MQSQELSDEQQRLSATRQNYYSQLKFMSVKQGFKNKKIIIKKTVPNNMFNATNEDPFFEGSFPTTEAKINVPRFGKILKKDGKQTKQHSCEDRKNNQSGLISHVVTLKFGDEVDFSKTEKQAKNRRKLFSQQAPDQRKKVNNSFKQMKGEKEEEDKSSGSKFNKIFVLEPFQRNSDGVLDLLEKKKFNTQLLLEKKNKKSSIGKNYGVNQTISDFKSVFIGQQRERKITTALDNSKQTQKVPKLAAPTKLQQKRQFKQLIPIRKPNNKKDHFVFGLTEKPINENQLKVQLYRDFLWKINYSNSLYVITPNQIDFGYQAFVGFGNNSCMIKSILKRRFWWNIIDDKSRINTCQFVWTQLKLNNFFKHQCSRLIIQKNEQKKENKFENRFNELQKAHRKIFNERDFVNWQKHYAKNIKSQEKITEQTYLKRINLFLQKSIEKKLDSSKIKMHNHLQSNYYIGNKKALYYNCKRLCQFRNQDIFKYLPVTFHIVKGIDDPIFKQFLNYYEKMQEIKKIDKTFRNIWIAKPGENTNQGSGISVCFSFDDIKHRLRGRERNKDGKLRTFILQKYIEKPFLFKNRKFDIRHYVLVTCVNGIMKAYWYEEGYIRTSSSHFNLKEMKNVQVHLTNDAVQKRSENYGKYQKGNKLSYKDFQKYLDNCYPKKKYNFCKKIIPKMKNITKMAIQSTYSILDSNRKESNFELLGLDFMIDENFNPWLIQVNTNPCLQLSCPLLEKIIPTLIQQTFRITIDPIFPPPENWNNNRKQYFGENALLQNKYELLFDEQIDGISLLPFREDKRETIELYLGKIQEDGDIFEDDGNDKWEENQN